MTYRSQVEADRILCKNLSDRYKRIDALERVVSCSQYEGMPDFWRSDVPLFDRSPIIKSRLVADAISDNKSLLLGEGHYPEITSSPGESSKRTGESDRLDDTLGPDESVRFDDLLEAIAHQTRLRAHERAKYGQAQAASTAVGLLGVRNRRLFAETVRAKWCTPTWRTQDAIVVGPEGQLITEPADGELDSVEIRYPYLQSEKVGGKTLYQVLLFRRVIDRQQDVTYLPVEANDDGSEPKPELWRPDPSKTLAHGFGFVPMVWWRFRAEGSESADSNEIDGRAIHEGVDVHALDMALSQRHRAALYLQPQIVEIGVNPGYNPTEEAPEPMGYNPSERIPKYRYRIAGQGEGGGRQKGPDKVWQYTGSRQDIEVKMLEASGDALRAIAEHTTDLEAKLAQTLSVVFLDPSRIKYAGAMSGRALKLMKLRQIDAVAEHFDDWEVESSQPTLSMLCRIALLKRDELDLPALKPALPILARFAKGDVWTFPQLTYIRPPSFDLDPEEEQMTITTAALAVEKNLATRIQGIRKAQGVMGGEDPQDTLDAIEGEAEERRQREMADATERARNEARVFHAAGGMSDGSGADSNGARPRAPKGKQTARSGSRSGSAVES